MHEPYSSPGQVSRSRKTGLKFTPRSRTRPISVSGGKGRPRLNTMTLGRRVALSQLPDNGASTSSAPPNLSSLQSSSGASPVSHRAASTSPPRVCGKPLPPRLLNLTAAQQSGLGSDVFMSGLPPVTYPLVPPVPLPPGLAFPPSSLTQATVPPFVNLVKQGSLNHQFHTIAIPMDVFTQQLVHRTPSDSFGPSTNSAAGASKSPEVFVLSDA